MSVRERTTSARPQTPQPKPVPCGQCERPIERIRYRCLVCRKPLCPDWLSDCAQVHTHGDVRTTGAALDG